MHVVVTVHTAPRGSPYNLIFREHQWSSLTEKVFTLNWKREVQKKPLRDFLNIESVVIKFKKSSSPISQTQMYSPEVPHSGESIPVSWRINTQLAQLI